MRTTILPLWGLLFVLLGLWLGVAERGDAAPPLSFGEVEKDQPQLIVQRGYGYGVSAVAFSQDRKLFATANYTEIRIFDVGTKKHLRTCFGHVDDINSISFSPGGNLIVSGGKDMTIRISDVKTCQALHVFKIQGKLVDESWPMPGKRATRIVVSVVFSPTGRMIASLEQSAEDTSVSSERAVTLWDVETGKKIQSLKENDIESIAFSTNGEVIALGTSCITLRSVNTGKKLGTFLGHDRPVTSLTFLQDGRTLVSASTDETIRFWDTATGRELRRLSIGHQRNSSGSILLALSHNEKMLASSGGSDGRIIIWSLLNHKRIRTIVSAGDERDDEVHAPSFSSDDAAIISLWDKKVSFWDIDTGKALPVLSDGLSRLYDIDLDYGVIASSFLDDSGAEGVRVSELKSMAKVIDIKVDRHTISSFHFSSDASMAASGSNDNKVRLWNVRNGKNIRTVHGSRERIGDVAFSPDGSFLLSIEDYAGEDVFHSDLCLWSIADGKKRHTFDSSMGKTRFGGILSSAFSRNGKNIASAGYQGVNLWDVRKGKKIFELKAGTAHDTAGEGIDYEASVAFSWDGRLIASGGTGRKITLWDAITGKKLKVLDGHQNDVSEIAFSPAGGIVASGSEDNTIKLWNVNTGQNFRTLQGHSDLITFLDFSSDGEVLASVSSDKSTRLWRVSDGALLATLYFFTNGDWAVVDPEGRYDASNGGLIDGLHWVAGNTPIDLWQLKERFYEPGLLPKILGYNPEPVRPLVSALHEVKLFPEVTLIPPGPEEPNLKVQLRSQGGGIGPVRVLLNGKEILADARAGRVAPEAESATLTVPLEGLPLVPGEENTLDVLAWNAEGYLSSRGTRYPLRGPNPEGGGDRGTNMVTLHAIAAGVSRYAAPHLNLSFAAKDASDFAHAARLGARRLFGAERVDLHLLATDTPEAVAPTRANLQQAFADVAKAAKPGDLLVIYLAGHGVMSPGEGSDYYYLTEDARTNDLTDPGVRAVSGVSSRELTDWIKAIPAQKQVMVLDTCAAGGAATRLASLMEPRALSSDQIRALERLKDRTGLHVLMGAAADRISYESSRYGQGLLTYALLEGMKGAALRDGAFVDVARLFQHASERVGALAQDNGWVQQPLLAVPRGASFDIGQMDDADKAQIRLERPKPTLLRASCEDAQRPIDPLELTRRVNARLRDVAAGQGRGGEIVFLDSDEFPGAYQLRGRYRVADSAATVEVFVYQGSEEKATYQVSGAVNAPDVLAERIVEQAIGAVRKP